jgi:RTA1 like protein
MYLITQTIAPAFLSAAIYLCLSRIVVVYGTQLFRFKPRTNTITSSLSEIGKNIMLASFGFQVFSLTLFIIYDTEFAFLVWNKKGNWNPELVSVLYSHLFKIFLLSRTVTILVRLYNYACLSSKLRVAIQITILDGYKYIY